MDSKCCWDQCFLVDNRPITSMVFGGLLIFPLPQKTKNQKDEFFGVGKFEGLRWDDCKVYFEATGEGD